MAEDPARLKRLDNDTVAPRSVPGLPSYRSRAGIPKRVRVLVLRAYWSGAAPRHPDTGEMKGVMRQVAAWFNRTSRGRHHVSSTVTPWIHIPGNSSNCDGRTWIATKNAVAGARRLGIDPAGYTRFMVVMPACGQSSYAEVPGRLSWIMEKITKRDTIVHELGHNLGLEHANSLICTLDKRRVTQGGRCTGEEYGDMWDAMGISSRPYSVGVLQRLGWAGKVVTARQSGTWRLADSEASGNGIQALRVKVSRRVSYWLEYKTTRTAIEDVPGDKGWDGDAGLQIRLDTGKKSMQVLDASPGNPDPNLIHPDGDLLNLALPVGNSFTTPQDVRITLLSQDSGGAMVTVTRGLPAAPPEAAKLDWVFYEAAGGYRLHVEPGAHDNGQVLLGYLATYYPGGKTVFIADPGGTRDEFVAYPEGGSAAQWSLRAVNQVGASPASATVAVTGKGPQASVVSPAAGSQVPGPVVHAVLDVQPNAVTHDGIDSAIICIDSLKGACATIHAAPWTADLWAEVGTHTVVAYVYGAEALDETRVQSAPFTVYAVPPSVHLDSPTEGATVSVGSNASVTATASPGVDGIPVRSVTFELVDPAKGFAVTSFTDNAAPWAAQLYVPYEGPFQVTAVARASYDSPASVVNITAVN